MIEKVVLLSLLALAAFGAAAVEVPVGEAAAGRYSLHQLERAAAEAAPRIAIAAEDVSMGESLLEKEEALEGMRFFGSAAVGRYKDLVDEDSVWYHTGGRFLGGLSYPLLGTAEKRTLAKLAAQASLKEKRILKEAAKKESLTALRLAYIDYWSAWRKKELAEAYLQGQRATLSALWKRVSAGLALASEALDAESRYLRASRALGRYDARRTESLETMRILTGLDLSSFNPYDPGLFLAPVSADARFFAEAVEKDPVVRIRRLRLLSAIEEARGMRYEAVESDLRLVGFVNPEYDSSRQGDGVEVSLNIRIPLELSKALEGERGARAARSRKALLELKLAASDALKRVKAAVAGVETARRGLAYARSRLTAAKAYLRETSLGLGSRERVTPELLEAARYRYFTVAEAYIDAYATLQARSARLLALAHARPAPEAGEEGRVTGLETPLTESLAALPARIRPSKSFGFYLWRSEEALRSPEAFLQRCRGWGVSRLLLSLDASQLKRLKRDPLYASGVQRFLSRAHGMGIEVEALLGEPTWLLEANRPKLLAIVHSLDSFDFDAIHLDIEPDQLEGDFTTQRKARMWLLTLQSVMALAEKPVGVSLHPRYLDPEKAGFDLAAALKGLRVWEVAVMLYGDKPSKSLQRLEKLTVRDPGLPWTLALSVERERFPGLPAERSAWLGAVRETLGEKPALSLLLQDYSHFARMRP